MKLTDNFTLSELTSSATGQRLGINNNPETFIISRLRLVAEMLERVRKILNAPIIVTSGYRCSQLNRAVGGGSSSDHEQGYAADIVAPGYGSSYEIAIKLQPMVAELGIGQLILEGIAGKRWVHLSTHAPESLVNRIITITDSGCSVGIKKLA